MKSGFDLQKTIRAMRDYCVSTGIGCVLIDNEGRVLSEVGGDDPTQLCKSCGLNCSNLKEKASLNVDCANAHLYGSYQAERFGGRYIFFCPLSLVHWASPIYGDGVVKASFIAGPVLMVDRDEYLLEDILKRFPSSKKSEHAIREALQTISYVPPDRVRSLSEMLYYVADSLSEDQGGDKDEESLEQQAHISEYVQQIKREESQEEKLPAYPLDKEKELVSLIALGDKIGSRKILNDILGHVFFSSGRNIDVMKARVLELVVLLSRAALEGGADAELIFGLNYHYLNQIHRFTTVEDLAYWLSRIMLRFTDCVFNLKDVKHADVIYKAVDYLKQNYMEKITLDDVAAQVYLSQSYFGKIFKEEMGENFNAYLNRFRIEKSQRLLKETKSSLVDVAAMVGFEDQSYFTKVFKKITGISPGRYREGRGKKA